MECDKLKGKNENAEFENHDESILKCCICRNPIEYTKTGSIIASFIGYIIDDGNQIVVCEKCGLNIIAERK